VTVCGVLLVAIVKSKDLTPIFFEES
jgi:hypothetical protein